MKSYNIAYFENGVINPAKARVVSPFDENRRHVIRF